MEVGLALVFVLVLYLGLSTVLPFLLFRGDGTVSAWVSSLQLAAVGGALLLAWRTGSTRAPGLLLLGAVFLFLSLDEMIALHERFARVLEGLLGAREGSLLPRSGPWPLVVAPLLLAVLAVGVYLGRGYLRAHRGPTLIFAAGILIFVASFAGIEVLANFTERGTMLGRGSVLLEELREMVGATVMLWGAYELLVAERLLPLTTTGPEADAGGRPASDGPSRAQP
jgi:hypothetical protein